MAHTEIDDDVLLSSEAFLALDNEQFFTGFDEVWLFTEAPASGKPDGLRMTSDQPLVSAPEGLEAWMREVGCIAGLGDGDGLNFAAFDAELARLWRPASQ